MRLTSIGVRPRSRTSDRGSNRNTEHLSLLIRSGAQVLQIGLRSFHTRPTKQRRPEVSRRGPIIARSWRLPSRVLIRQLARPQSKEILTLTSQSQVLKLPTRTMAPIGLD